MTTYDTDLGLTVYLDNAATSYPKPEAVYAAMDLFARRVGGSGGRSSHRRAIESSTVIDGARESVAELLGAHAPECVCFGSNATDALNTAIYGLAEPGQRIVTSLMEHNSVRRPLADLRSRYDCDIVSIGADSQGLWDPKDVIAALTPDTAFVVLSWASNVTGALQEIEPVAQACRSLGIPIVVDGAQVCGVYPMNFKSLGFGVLAFTGHKSLLGPQGTGGLVVDPELAPRIRPLRRGGSGTVSHSESHPDVLPDRFEAGTPNCHGLSGLHTGVQYLLERGVERVRAHEMALWRRFRDGLEDIDHVRIYGPEQTDRSVSIVSVAVDGMQPVDVGFLLDMRHGVLTRTGLHCAPGAHQSIGTLPTGTIRFSMGFSTTEDEVDIALYALSHIRDRDGVRTVTLPPARPVEPPREETVQAASDKCYHVDRLGFLVNPQEWDERFAQGIAHELGIQEDLTDDHWKIVRFLRAETAAKGQCPLVYHTCKKNGISLEDLQRLFPTGYLRGACKIAGVTYRDEVIDEPPAAGEEGTAHPAVHDKTYPVNARGFLVSPTDWDETFAICKAAELGIVGTLTEKHWRVIHHLRECWDRARKVPTIFEACSECSITLDEMERLFPTGYHRGAVKIAGLHVL